MSRLKYLMLLLLISFTSATAWAEIYKYKDAKGNWQFSDKAKKGAVNSELVTFKKSSGKVPASRNYDVLLNKKYKPANAVEQATLAVVTVKSNIGTGSGFFVSDDCYLVTNKHVVRPTKGRQWEKTQARIKRNEDSFNQSKLNIANEEKRLKINKQELDEFKAYVGDLSSGGNKTREQKKYQLYLDRYTRAKDSFERYKKRFNVEQKQFLKQKSDSSFSGSVANTAQSFDIVLKDNTKTRANLIKISSTEDLALLKISQCKSPYLSFSDSRNVSQGMDIYAIGSPLGLRDQLTKGTVTQITHEGIATDAQILPGNSGGPLISDKGSVVGVNTLKVAKGSALETGFGIAIPSSKVKQNFGSYIK